jgi:hypothetical protein
MMTNNSLASQLKLIGLRALPTQLDDFIARVTKARCSARQILEELGSRGRNLPLRHFVDGIDVIQAFASLLISLVQRVDAQKARFAARLGLAPFTDRNRGGPCGLIGGVALAVRRTVAQSV